MDRRSATIIGAALVVALMAGTVSRAVTYRPVAGAAPVQIVVRAPAQVPATTHAPTPPVVERK